MTIRGTTSLFAIAFSVLAQPVLACQVSTGWEEREAALELRNRQEADLVVLGSWQPDEACPDFGLEHCIGRLSVSSIERGEASSSILVEYHTDWSMCEAEQWVLASEFGGRFYLSRDSQSGVISINFFEELEVSEK